MIEQVDEAFRRITVQQLARHLYALQFPRRKFEDLPEYVQDSWKRDAHRLKEMVEHDTRPSGN